MKLYLFLLQGIFYTSGVWGFYPALNWLLQKWFLSLTESRHLSADLDLLTCIMLKQRCNQADSWQLLFHNVKEACRRKNQNPILSDSRTIGRQRWNIWVLLHLSRRLERRLCEEVLAQKHQVLQQLSTPSLSTTNPLHFRVKKNKPIFI